MTKQRAVMSYLIHVQFSAICNEKEEQNKIVFMLFIVYDHSKSMTKTDKFTAIISHYLL